MSHAADPLRDLLFGMFALQNGLIDQSALVGAFHAWTLDKSRRAVGWQTISMLTLHRAPPYTKVRPSFAYAGFAHIGQ